MAAATSSHSKSATPTTSDMPRQNATTDPAPAKAKKTKGKSPSDPVNTGKAIEDTIAQLERSRAGEKDQEVEIEREVKKATREMSNLLSSMESSTSRLDALQKKNIELLTEMKKTQRELTRSKKRADQLQKERDFSRSELSKVTTVKEKLEKLCRELQKENKLAKGESKKLKDDEIRFRNELHERLEYMSEDVRRLQDQNECLEDMSPNLKSDELFRQKFKSFIDQYELRELQFQSLFRLKELEVQYHISRFEQQRRAQEHEMSKSRQLTTQVSTFSQTEAELRNQLNIYVEKFKQVEDTLNNSNDLFLTFRKEMEEMSKKTKRLEKENHTLTRKYDQTNHNILQMAEERTRTNREIELLRRKNANLEKLCRGMQEQGRGQIAGGKDSNNDLDSEATDSDDDNDVDDYEGSEDPEEDVETDEDAIPESDGLDELARPKDKDSQIKNHQVSLEKVNHRPVNGVA